MKRLMRISVVISTMLALALFVSEPFSCCAAVPEQELAANAVNAFAIDLYKQILKPKGNVFFSPYSVSMSLAMAYTGARERTASQIANVLHFDTNQPSLNKALMVLNAQIIAAGQGKAAELNVANALWAEKSFRFRKEFVESIRGYQIQGGGWFSQAPLLPQVLKLVGMSDQGDLPQLDFQNQPNSARKTINDWVEGQTKQRIRNLLPPDAITRDTRVVLTNAIYFKGLWEYQFKKERTKEAPFIQLDGKEIQVPTMHNTEAFDYLEQEGLQLLEIPYRDGDLSMLVLLPSKEKRFDDLEQTLTLDMFGEWVRKLRNRKVEVYMPKFKMAEEFRLQAALTQLGMADAFSPTDADFSGMTGKKDLFIDESFHKAFVEVNEQGTEAAATTGLDGKITGWQSRIPVFRADHPFVFFILHKPTTCILFLGRVTNP